MRKSPRKIDYINDKKECSLEDIEYLIKIILESDELNKLKGNTQIIFTSGKHGKKIRNRGIHTLDVAAMSQSIAKKIGLDKSQQRLAYLIGLCHDLGHTAFGHDGECRVDMALKSYGITVEEFNNFYINRYINEKDRDTFNESSLEYEEPDYSFEHHIHSTRIFDKIMKENGIELGQELRNDIIQGIICHSESRTEDKDVRKHIWSIARYADKIYAYTDMRDILETGLKIPDDLLDKINSKPEYIKSKKTGEQVPFTEEDKDILNNLIKELSSKNGIITAKSRYAESAVLCENNERYKVEAGPKESKKESRILKIVTSFLRQEHILNKKELLAEAMIDEVIEYQIEHFHLDLPLKDRVMIAALTPIVATDEEIRELYSCISKDKEWQEKMKNVGEKAIRNAETLAIRAETEAEVQEKKLQLLKNELEILERKAPKNEVDVEGANSKKDEIEAKKAEIRGQEATCERTRREANRIRKIAEAKEFLNTSAPNRERAKSYPIVLSEKEYNDRNPMKFVQVRGR